jgi:GT2 family glycosyltransferase
MLRSDFILAGGFDERLSDSEDFDLSVRLLKMGRRVFYDTSFEVLHHDYADLSSTIRRQNQYYISKQKLVELHPDYFELVPGQFVWVKPTFKDTVKYLMFDLIPGWERLFKTRFFQQLPVPVKAEFYSSYIYAKSTLRVKNRK